MGLNNFVAKEPRPLPIFVLADTSGSMSGSKINELNLALREMLSALKSADEVRGKFQMCVISFGGSVRIEQELADISDITLSELSASGNTPMGQAIDTVRAMVEDREVVSSRAYSPTIVLISDGIPTDCDDRAVRADGYAGWRPLQELCSGARSSKCQRLALGIGTDADTDMLKAFINNPEIPLIKTADASGIARFFKWVTMSTMARMNSVNPNAASVVAPIFDFDDEEILI